MKEFDPRDRYDKEEDRANDVKTHDNPNHDGKHANDMREQEADQQITDHEEGNE